MDFMTSALSVFQMCIREILLVMHGSEACALGNSEINVLLKKLICILPCSK